MKTLEELQQIIAKKINGFCEKNGTASIYQPINYILQLEGKRLRPALNLMAANLFSDEIEDAIYPAVAVEIFHNFTLLHDDIMDNAPLRRGKPTVHEKWNSNVAILSGDAMMIQAYQLLIKTRPELLTSILPIFNKTALEVCEGQQQDMDFEKRSDVTVAEYEEMIRLKTSVLLAGAMQIGTLIGGADKESQKLIYDFGINVGLSFQLLDDYLDAFGDESKTGKQKGGDILADKKTFLWLRAMEKGNEEDKKTLRSFIGNSHISSTEKVTGVITLYKKLGVDSELKAKTLAHHQSALSLLEKISVSPERKIPLSRLIERMLEREF